jgi:Xaa-Pro aminopeptidase
MSKIEAGEYDSRVEAFRRSLSEKDMDAFVATSLPAMRYLCGYTGREEAALILTPSDLVLIVGRLHVEMEQKLTFGTKVIEKEGTLPKTIAMVLKDGFPSVVGVEGDDMSVSKLRDIRAHYESPDYKAEDDILVSLREVKSDAEVEAIKESLACAENAFLKAVQIAPVCRSTEKELAAQMEYQMMVGGADAVSFPVRTGYGDSCGTPHMLPGGKVAAPGDVVMFDWGAVVDGYHSDISRTGFVGKPDAFWTKIYNGVVESLMAMELEVKPGMKAYEVYSVAEKSMQRSLGDVIESNDARYGLNFGHGIGVEEHESPHISFKSEDVIRAGNVICMEPSLYLFGKGCVHVEDMYLVTEDGVQRLSTKLSRKMLF